MVNGRGGEGIEWDRGLLRFNFRLTDFRKLGLGVLLIFFFRILFPFFFNVYKRVFFVFFRVTIFTTIEMINLSGERGTRPSRSAPETRLRCSIDILDVNDGRFVVVSCAAVSMPFRTS